jgi:hypothetical protein
MTPWSVEGSYQRFVRTSMPLFMVREFLYPSETVVRIAQNARRCDPANHKVKCSLPWNPDIFCSVYIEVYLLGGFQKLTPGSATCSQFDWKYVCLLLPEFCLSVFLRRTEEAASAGETCLRPSLLWGVVHCRLAVAYLHKRSSEMEPTCAETSLWTPQNSEGLNYTAAEAWRNICFVSGRCLVRISNGTPVILIEIFRDCGECLESNCRCGTSVRTRELVSTSVPIHDPTAGWYVVWTRGSVVKIGHQ